MDIAVAEIERVTTKALLAHGAGADQAAAVGRAAARANGVASLAVAHSHS